MKVIIRQLGLQPYIEIFTCMREFTQTRTPTHNDEIWFVEHPPVFTQGQAGKAEHVQDAGDIPIVQTDRGGQVTYHGPGQLVAYVLLDIKRLGQGVRPLVTALEQAIIATLKDYQIDAIARPDAPGVYVKGNKIASLGLRIRQGCSYHGLALNIDMDKKPWQRIHPCGYKNLQMTQMCDFTTVSLAQVQPILQQHLIHQLHYASCIMSSERPHYVR